MATPRLGRPPGGGRPSIPQGAGDGRRGSSAARDRVEGVPDAGAGPGRGGCGGTAARPAPRGGSGGMPPRPCRFPGGHRSRGLSGHQRSLHGAGPGPAGAGPVGHGRGRPGPASTPVTNRTDRPRCPMGPARADTRTPPSPPHAGAGSSAGADPRPPAVPTHAGALGPRSAVDAKAPQALVGQGLGAPVRLWTACGTAGTTPYSSTASSTGSSSTTSSPGSTAVASRGRMWA